MAPLTPHVAGVVEVNVTGFPEAPPAAVTTPVPPTTTVGAAPNVMVWLACPTANDCVTWGAAA